MWAGNSILFPLGSAAAAVFLSLFFPPRFEYSSAVILPLVWNTFSFLPAAASRQTPPSPTPHGLLMSGIDPREGEHRRLETFHPPPNGPVRSWDKEGEAWAVFTSLSSTTAATQETGGHILCSATAEESGGACTRWRMWRELVFGDLCLYEHQRKQGLSRERTVFCFNGEKFREEMEGKSRKAKVKARTKLKQTKNGATAV